MIFLSCRCFFLEAAFGPVRMEWQSLKLTWQPLKLTQRLKKFDCVLCLGCKSSFFVFCFFFHLACSSNESCQKVRGRELANEANSLSSGKSWGHRVTGSDHDYLASSLTSSISELPPPVKQ